MILSFKREKIMLNIFMEYIDKIYAAREMRHEKVEDTFNFDLCRAEVVCARPGSLTWFMSHEQIGQEYRRGRMQYSTRRDQAYRTTDCLAAAD